MFLGEYLHTIDDKGRLTIPAKFRGGLATGLVVTKGMDRCLVIYPMEAWRALKGRIAGLPFTDRNARDFRRLLFASATDAVPDGQGRINIPQALREYAGLDGQVIVAGCDTYIEVWSPQGWSDVQARVEEDDDNVERWAALGI
ncbi:MAG TPA: division/cell wall cluster transcriptional repressor MraZ [Anaerolineae bacterium]|nr:division/cell wall cluster transcriptional repressor MraZ [Anaerolineae bacterium]